MNNTSVNISIYKHTVDHCLKSKFKVEPSIMHTWYNLELADINLLPGKKIYGKPTIHVANTDTFNLARAITDPNAKPVLVLNLASESEPGGGVARGAQAQEEDLFRKSNYFQTLTHDFYKPVFTMAQIVYSPLVHIIKDHQYRLLDNPVVVSCVAIPAIPNPPISQLNNQLVYTFDFDKDIMRNKIDLIFRVAIKYGHTHLVLGALGCGVYGHPPELIAIMFKDSIKKYGMYFKKIGFAVLSKDGNKNYEVFKNILNDI